MQVFVRAKSCPDPCKRSLRRIVRLHSTVKLESVFAVEIVFLKLGDLYGAFSVSVYFVFGSIEEMTMLVSVIFVTTSMFTKCLLLQF